MPWTQRAERPADKPKLETKTGARKPERLAAHDKERDKFAKLENGGGNNGKKNKQKIQERSLEKPKQKKRKHTQKVLRAETRVAEKLRTGDKVLNSELRRDLAYLSRELQSSTLGG